MSRHLINPLVLLVQAALRNSRMLLRLIVNFLINLRYGDDSKLFNRNPRLSFEQACTVL